MLRSFGFAQRSDARDLDWAESAPYDARPHPAVPLPIRSDTSHPSSPFVSKLKNFVELDFDDTQMLERLGRGSRMYAADESLIQEGSSTGCVCIMMSGLAFRYKMLRNGHRQILGYLLPGDLCDLSFTLLNRADYSVTALVESQVTRLPISKLSDALASNAKVRRAVELSAHLDTVIMRQWLVNVGQRKAHQKLSYFLYEMTQRLRIIRDDDADGWIDFPLTQPMLADTIGTTPVHINRTLQRLRREGAIALGRRRLRILDTQKLLSIANFEGNYLNSIDYRVKKA